jgi:UDP-glucose 4-epimerase
MNTVLITGAYGFLGRHTALLFKERGYRVIGMGHGHWDFEHPGDFGIDQWIETDIDFYSLAKIKEKIDCIVHCAGGSSVGYSVQYPLRDFHRTVTSSINILEYIRLHQPQVKFVYPSSAAVYGKKDNKPIREDDDLCPVSPYGFHKRIVEELCASYAANFGLSTAIVRFFSVYGPGLKKQLLWDACNKFSHPAEEVVFSGTGDETRDWIHVKDAAELIFCLAKSSGKYEIINGGVGETRTIRQILTCMAAMFEETLQVTFNQEYREGDPKHYWADISEAKKRGWQPVIGIEDGLREYVEWFGKQRKN